MMLQRSCQSLLSRLLQAQVACSCHVPAAAAFSSRSGVKRETKRQRLLAEVAREEQNQPGYIDELADTKHLMGLAESSTAMGASLRSQMRRQHRAAVIRRVTAAKMAKLRPPEANLLTWSAKRQIMELIGRDPDLWTVKALTDAFPVSPAQARELSRKAHRGDVGPQSPVSIFRHDRKVLERLRELKAAESKSGEAPKVEGVKPGFEWLVRSDKWHLLHCAGGNPVLPLPQKHLIEDALEAEARRPLGPFEALAKAQMDAVVEASSRRRQKDRLTAFIERCERQKSEVEQTLRLFTTADTRELYRTAGLLSKSAESSTPVASAAESSIEVKSTVDSHMTMFAAVAATPQASSEEGTSSEVTDDKGEAKDAVKKPSFGDLVEQLEATNLGANNIGLPKSNLNKFEGVRQPLRYRSRVNMDHLRIFRYYFGRQPAREES